MVATKKMKKSLESINFCLQLVLESATYELGYKQTLKMIQQGKAKPVIPTNDCPVLRKSEAQHYALVATMLVHDSSSNNVELGTACGNHSRAV
ncbi:60S ribosomal protein L30-like [Sorex fumeus]|uniref:60S ribosomal protein L30-like n=1 Tax=Sorex fumeus TaxID=62283 RepID=UPI0024ADE93F|nr:60S ribosomal protein L30-like [Sorex fumeus]